MSAPTKADKAYWSRLAHEVGCIACRLDDGVINRRVSIHHINGRTKPGAHRQVLPKCDAILEENARSLAEAMHA